MKTYNIIFHDLTPFALNVMLLFGRKYGLAPYESTVEQTFLLEYRASPSITSMLGHISAVCSMPVELIPHRKFIKGVMLIRAIDVPTVRKYLDTYGTQYYIADIRLTHGNDEVLHRITP